MKEQPAWLPKILELSPWTNQRFEELYKVFTETFIASKPQYNGEDIYYFPEKDDGKIALFWHLVQKEDKTRGIRIPDLRRCERLHWIKPILENIHDPMILHWDYLEGDGSIKTYIWLKDFDYLIVLKKLKNGRRLITAFFVEYSGAKKGLYNKYEKRIKKEDSD